MVEGGREGTDSGSRSVRTSSFESAGGRLRVRVVLKPGETTIVSWKKLHKEATSSNSNVPDPSVAGPHSDAPQPAPQLPMPPPSMASSSKQLGTEDEAKEAQGQVGSSRLNNVIERIERLYAGHGSSDEEDVVLDDMPDEDDYDTDDSFIDDADLDEYFQVDNSSLKHDGFFVNRGKLERIEPTLSAYQQTKKRRRKDLAKATSGSDGHNPSKHVKLGDKGRKSSSSTERKSVNQTSKVPAPNVHGLKGALSVSVQSNGSVIGQKRDADQQRTEVISLKNHSNKHKEDVETQDTVNRRLHDRSLSEHESQYRNNVDDIDQSIQLKEKVVHVERFDLNVPACKDSLQTTKVPLVQRREGSSARPKSTNLEKAFRELEKTVAECRPPATDIQDPDNSSQAIKRRLSPEIKQNIAKVARLAQASYGKIPKDVINRLMSIVGHLMQLRTLKRNLKMMENMGLSAKQEEDNKVQRIKQEVADMVKLRMHCMKPKVDQQTANLDTSLEADSADRESLKRKFSIDDALESKICDLYDLYVEHLEEDSGPPVRRLYEELAALWPCGIMNSDAIKHAIYRAKDRRKALSNQRKDQQKMKKKKVLNAKPDDAATRGETTAISQASHVNEKLLLEARKHHSTSTSKSNLDPAVSFPSTCMPVSLPNGPNQERSKQEKMKSNSSRISTDAKPMEVVQKNKVKRKPETDVGETQPSLEKVASHVEERPKLHKPMTPLTKPNLLSGAPSNPGHLN